jgi:radical SAM/Cys-rich protein
MDTEFRKAVSRIDPRYLRLEQLKTLQINLGNRCNQKCAHCHVLGSPDGTRTMNKEVMKKIIVFLRDHPGLCVDMTGGCPELNPDFRFLVEQVHNLAASVIVRTNFTVLFEPEMEWLPEWYRDHKVTIIGSLPCYTKDNVNKQRGANVFDKSIEAIRLLNRFGYGLNETPELDLVYNPGGDFLPASQEKLEADYKRELNEHSTKSPFLCICWGNHLQPKALFFHQF